ncbi:6-phosphogluconate phosphatase [Drechslerella dactyloides]|uniref:6-phosphogluconate phosphatase n=1 Tax=Drechslerella dactyloides TaxID=74499 RepID=A0AAD6J2Q7_DREDA|nr:6-phosphogluconate phosphatase [Drechslerella dactyloides]
MSVKEMGIISTNCRSITLKAMEATSGRRFGSSRNREDIAREQEIATLLFDCDNTLVLSEEIAFDVCAILVNEILDQKCPTATQRFAGPDLQSTFVGQNFAGMLKSLQLEHGFVLTEGEYDSYVARELRLITDELSKRAEPCEGVNEVLDKLQESGKYQFAVVSSSAKTRVLAALKKAGQAAYFPDEWVFSAMTSLEVPTSKPDPAIYLHATKFLGKEPSDCVAIEDSGSGVGSASRAGIWTIGYVGPYEESKRDEMAGKLREKGAQVIMQHWSEFEKCLAEIQAIKTTKAA